ncbi:nitrate- and nitrite sensing domain-containing protein [Actinomadura vinacea]|uniref:histidine kinase n=1 Tax=Actinomadura vinacea TaxID=115336 RepID=A0ABP5W731_9ACTN
MLLFLVPVLSLIALWAVAASLTLGDTLDHRASERSAGRLRAAVQDAVFALGTERHATAAFLGAPAGAARDEVDAARGRTDAVARTFRARANEELDDLGGSQERAAVALREALRELDRLPATRSAADSRNLEPVTAIESLSAPVEAMYAFTEHRAAAGDGRLRHWSTGLVAGSRAMDLMTRQSALVAAAAAGDGKLTGPEHRRFVETVAGQRRLWADQRAHMPAAVHARVLAPLFTSPAYTEFRALEERVAGAAADEAEVDARRWSATVQPLLGSLNSAHLQAARMLGQEQDARGDALLLRLSLAGGLGLLAVVGSVLVAFRSGRGLARELAGLRTTAEPAGRPPESLSRLARGEKVELEPAAPVPPLARTTEIRQIATAVGALRRTATEAAAGRAEMRAGVDRVFLNIARRNQSLLHRQLAMLEEIRAGRYGDGHGDGDDDGEGAAELRRLGDLTTRMRRHAESLIILSGAASGRGRRGPVPMADVLGEAVAEIEERDRVAVLTRTRDGLAGGAAADVVHLLAELLENAAAYSPPSTEIRLLAERVGSGFAVEVEDRGLGLGDAELDELNGRLAAPPEFDLGDTDRLGLFVVARLAARHGVRVSLRPSPYGGTTAIVLLPRELIVPAERMPRAALTGPADADDRPEPMDPMDPIPSVERMDVAEEEAPPEPASAPGPVLRTGPALVRRTVQRNDQDAPEPGVSGAKAASAGNPWFDDVADPAFQAADGDVAPREGRPPPSPEVDARAGANGAGGTNGRGPSPGPADTHAGLPRRRRQESLAPQLRRKDGTPPPPAAEQGPAGVIVRSPEEARSMMASIQQGWRRARASDPGDEEAR